MKRVYDNNSLKFAIKGHEREISIEGDYADYVYLRYGLSLAQKPINPAVAMFIIPRFGLGAALEYYDVKKYIRGKKLLIMRGYI